MHTHYRGLRCQLGVGVEGWGSTANASQTAHGQTRVEDPSGRSLIRISGVTEDLPRLRTRSRGTRKSRPVRRQVVSSPRSAPRPRAYSAW